MFKLESYVTPILLDYVAKYVKNFRDEDAQISLWEGEVTFQNLDLRLDVLEDELNLPVELVSGHIHELSIQVPWTKLTSEPVRIVINTIEFVAKLPNDEDTKAKADRRKKKLSDNDAVQQPPGGISSGVINKIINNIYLECHNIILKYVEDDIVVSMNVQHLCLSSADDQWNSAMVDVHPVAVLIRKVLKLSDLTICLDKRNTAGRIEVCQEPVLYRCTLECRVLRKYNVNTASTTSTMRIGVFTKSLDINVSSLQFPMVIRLIKMALEFSPEKPDDDDDDLFPLKKSDATLPAENPLPQPSAQVRNNMLSWAWNLLPSFDTTQDVSGPNEPIGHAFDLGIYAQELNFQLKNSELFTDHVMGIKRIRYTPIMRITLGGIYYERSQFKEKDWANMRAGLTSISMEPLGFYRNEGVENQGLVHTKEFMNSQAFVDKSLFDQQYMYADRTWFSHNYDEYYARQTDEYMLSRSPVLAFDIVEYRVPTPATSQMPPDKQLQDVGLRIKYRLLSAGITFHFSQSFLQVKNVISDLLRPYDYSGYYAEKSEENHPVTKSEEYKNEYMTYKDFQFLIGVMPVCNYKIDLRNITIKFYPRRQSATLTAGIMHRLSTTIYQSQLPHLQLNLSSVTGTICGPANPKRLVQLITHLEDKPKEVVDSCYNTYQLQVNYLTITMMNKPNEGKAKLLKIPDMQVNFNKLLLPHLWRQNIAPLEKAEILTELITLEFSKREFIVFNQMIYLILNYDVEQIKSLMKMTDVANKNFDVIKLQTMVSKLRFKYHKYHTNMSFLTSIRSLNTDVYHTEMNIRNVVLTTNKGIYNKWFEMQLQVPLVKKFVDSDDSLDQVPLTALCVWIEKFRITIDVYLVQFFKSFVNPVSCFDTEHESDTDTISDPEKVSSFSSVSLTSYINQIEPIQTRKRTKHRRVSVPAETIHASSERDEKPTLNPTQDSKPTRKSPDIYNLIDKLSSLTILVELAGSRIDVCEVMLRDNLGNTQNSYTSIRLPITKFKTGDTDNIVRGNIRKIIFASQSFEMSNWLMEMNDFSVCMRQGPKTDIILAPLQIKTTIANSQKSNLKPRKKDVRNSSTLMMQDKLEIENSKKKVDWQEEADEVEERTYSINIHVDMSEITLYGRCFKLLREHYDIVQAISICLLDANTVCSTGKRNKFHVVTANGNSIPIIKEFLELEPETSSSEKNSDLDSETTLIIFCQWTIPRISMEMESNGDHHNRKIIFTLEDLLLNVDRHPDFTKFTTKVENINLHYLESKKGSSELERVNGLNFKMLGDSSNLPMISVVVTIVSLKDLYSKIGARNLDHKSRTISEILIDLQPIEMILDLNIVTEFLIWQCELLEVVGSNNPPFVNQDHSQSLTTVKDLPMVHLNSKGIYFYIPMERSKESSTLLLMQIESIKLSPNVENPLVRNPIRQDIYNKAAELNILNTPGSLVEDRQYELSVRKISLSTGSWEETQKYRLESSAGSSHSNPAFEWNNQPIVTELEQIKIFKNFDFITIYAPAMTYDRFLVSGELIEYNCVTDFEATLNTHQIHMMLWIVDHAYQLVNVLSTICVTSSRTESESFNSSLSRGSQSYIPVSNIGSRNGSDIMYGSCNSDSGINLAKKMIKVAQNNINVETTQKPRTKHTLPRSVSFVAGIFSLKIFNVIETQRPFKLRPLVKVTISQPSYLYSKTMLTEVTQASVFDLNISLAKRYVDSVDPKDQVFNESLFDTLPIILGTGIPSSLLTIKAHQNRHGQMEVDVNLGKPILIRLCESTVMPALSELLRVYTMLSETPYFAKRSERPVVSAPPLGLVKQLCFNADRLNLTSNQLTVKLYDEARSYECSGVCLDFNAILIARTNKVSIKATLGTFYVQAGDKILLHPTIFRMSTDLLSESWCDQLIITSTLKLNMIHVDASITSALHLQKAHKSFLYIMENVNYTWQQYIENRVPFGVPLFDSRETLLKFMPNANQVVYSKMSQKRKVEFYQDDLRAGAFQFVDLDTDTMLPMPYQVQIIKKKYGIICWRYPQPRQMHKIFVNPVPMPVDNPIHIKCRMEYFSETHETFLHYCDFYLSESNSKSLTLPERNICANIWRVIILQSLISVDNTCFEHDTDEELQSIDSNHAISIVENDFILHPKVLVGCMRIDTKFHPDLVPKLQFLLSCQSIEVNFLNQRNQEDRLPPQLKNYNVYGLIQPFAFLTVNMESLQVHSRIFSATNYTVEMNFRSRIKCLDCGFFNMVDILEPTTFHGFVHMNKVDQIFNANILMDKLRFNCGPWVINTLICSKQHWLAMMQQEVSYALMPRCAIVNRLDVVLTYGQTGTNERFQLEPHNMNFYYFGSDYHNQELTFFVENTETNEIECSQSVHIVLKFEDGYKVSHSRIGNRCITIKHFKLSASQWFIIIKGQIEVMSFVPYNLYAEFRVEGKPNENENDPAFCPVAHLLKAKSSFYQVVERNVDVNMRLKLPPDECKGRTGDIPLKPNNNLPWLVKIPTQTPQQFISVWVRVLREDIAMDNVEDGFQPQKILVCIWPIFEICNLLNCYIRATKVETNEVYDIPGEGSRLALSTATTHTTDHLVKFKFPCLLGVPKEDEYTFSLKSMDCHQFFQFDPQKWTIEKTLNNFDVEQPVKWPMDDPEELCVRRSIKELEALDIQYRVEATREFSCTLGLEISAWGMFINATGVNVSLYIPKLAARHCIDSNCMAMLPALDSHFTIDVSFGSNWIPSMPICLNQEMQSALAASGGGRHNLLNANSFMDIVVVISDEVFRMILEHKVQDGKRVFKLRSKFVIANFTDDKIYALPLTMDHKETATREDVESLDVAKNIRYLLSKTFKNNSIGVTMELFHDLTGRKIKHTSDTAFVYFVSFAVSGSHDVSIPIPLAMPFTRRCFSIQNGAESIPVMITLIEKDNVFYLNVFRDTAPAIMINNNTNVKFIVAQTSASGNSNVTCTQSEFTGQHFEWHQLVMPLSKCYYTPPQMYANFPDVEFTMCNLSLATYNAPSSCSKSKIGWSKPIRMDKSWKKFMHVPNHGDIKVVICDKHRVIHFNIYYMAQQLEFSVKDLRSRLTKPESSALKTEETNVMEIKDEDEDADEKIPDIDTDCMHFKEECEEKMELSVRVFIKSFVFSLQTNHPDRDCLKTEVCNIYADDVVLAYDDNEERRQLNLQLPNVQVDNQLYSDGKYDFPVLLCAQQLYQRNCCLPKVYELDAVYQRQAEEKPVSLLTFDFYEDEMKLHSGRCQLQPLRVYIEDAYLNRLLDTLVECVPSNCVYTPHVKTKHKYLQNGQTLLPTEVVAQALYISEPLRLNNFVVEPLSLLLSVHTSSRLYIALDHSPLSFSRYERHQILTVPLRFGQSLGLHYLSGAIFGAGWVVGSLEILGSPSGLARSFSTGLRDFIAMPVEGLFRGPWGFVVGVTQGSASLLRNVTAGTVNSVTKLAGSVARNLDRLTLDSEHIELTEARRRARPQGFADGLTQGLTGLGISLLGAVGGIAHHTLEARSSVGVLTGLTKGIVGALTKPISGAAEMLALTGQGVLHTVGFNTMPLQVEPSVTRNVALHVNSSRIWRFMPEKLMSDQILFFQEITLMVEGNMHPALLFVTSTVLVILERQREELSFYSSVLRVDAVADREDPSKIYLSLRSESSESEGDQQENFTNERIMSFLNASRKHIIGSHELNNIMELDYLDQDIDLRKTECMFYIKPNLGEHLIHYLKVIRQTQ